MRSSFPFCVLSELEVSTTIIPGQDVEGFNVVVPGVVWGTLSTLNHNYTWPDLL